MVTDLLRSTTAIPACRLYMVLINKMTEGFPDTPLEGITRSEEASLEQMVMKMKQSELNYHPHLHDSHGAPPDHFRTH